MNFLKLFNKYKEIISVKKEIEECLFDFSDNSHFYNYKPQYESTLPLLIDGFDIYERSKGRRQKYYYMDFH